MYFYLYVIRGKIYIYLSHIINTILARQEREDRGKEEEEMWRQKMMEKFAEDDKLGKKNLFIIIINFILFLCAKQICHQKSGLGGLILKLGNCFYIAVKNQNTPKLFVSLS